MLVSLTSDLFHFSCSRVVRARLNWSSSCVQVEYFVKSCCWNLITPEHVWAHQYMCLPPPPILYESKCEYGRPVSWSKSWSSSALGKISTCKLQGTNETGPLPLCTFSVMGLSMCSSIFSESSPERSKSGIINELSGLPNSVPTVRCSYTSSSWHGHTGHAYCICFVGKH